MRCPWFICESAQRWERAVRCFGSRSLPEEEDELIIQGFDRHDQCLEAVNSEPSAVIIWELPLTRAEEILEAITVAQLSNCFCLQFVGLDIGSTLHGKRGLEVEACLREIGAVTTLTTLTDICGYDRLIRTHWHRNRKTDNLSMAREIWGRLPWNPVSGN